MKKLLLTMLILMIAFTSAATYAAPQYAPIELSTEQRAAANLFLSNFTETDISACDSESDDYVLVDFAHDHLWFNDHDSYEYGEYGNGNNCRVPDDRIQEIIDKYFYGPRQVDLSQTRFDYEDGYYYHCETGGWVPGGFAYTVSMCPIGDNMYYVSFMVFAGGDFWDNSVMDDSLAEIEAAYGHPCGYGCAVIYADDISQRSTYKMVSYTTL